MIRVIFYRSRSPYWPLALEAAKQAHSCEREQVGSLERYECVFLPAQRRAAARLVEFVRSWKGAKVYFDEQPFKPTWWGTLQCCLNAPDDPKERQTYCRGTSARGCHPPCQRIVKQGIGVPWLALYSRPASARVLRVNRARVAEDARQAVAEYGVALCPFYKPAAVRRWLRELPKIMELHKDDPVLSVFEREDVEPVEGEYPWETE